MLVFAFWLFLAGCLIGALVMLPWAVCTFLRGAVRIWRGQPPL